MEEELGGGIMEEERRHASPEGLRSEKDAVSIVKHSEHEQSATKTTNKHSKIYFFDVRCSFSLCFHSQHFRDLTLYHVFLAIGAGLGEVEGSF